MTDLLQHLWYDFRARLGTVRLDYGCTDFHGCIKAFKNIDPEVERIEVLTEFGYPDIRYTKNAAGRVSLTYPRFEDT